MRPNEQVAHLTQSWATDEQPAPPSKPWRPYKVVTHRKTLCAQWVQSTSQSPGPQMNSQHTHPGAAVRGRAPILTITTTLTLQDYLARFFLGGPAAVPAEGCRAARWQLLSEASMNQANKLEQPTTHGVSLLPPSQPVLAPFTPSTSAATYPVLSTSTHSMSAARWPTAVTQFRKPWADSKGDREPTAAHAAGAALADA